MKKKRIAGIAGILKFDLNSNLCNYLQNLDKNNDGYLSKTEFNKLLKNLSKEQVNLFKKNVCFNFFKDIDSRDKHYAVRHFGISR